MAYYTVPQIIDIAKVSAFLVANDIDRGNLFGERLDPQWALRLYLERTAVEWMYEMDPAYPTLTATANYLYALCGGYGRRAAVVIAAGGTGQVLSPVSPEDAADDGAGRFVYLIPIRGTSFDTTNLVDGRAVKYNDPDIVGEQVEIYWNEVNRYLAPSEFAYTATGIQILIPEFDAADPDKHLNSTFKIYIVHPDIVGETTVVEGPGGSSSGTSVEYAAGGAATYVLPENTVLNYMIVFPGSDTNFMIGTGVGLDDVLPDQPVVTSGTLISLNRYGGLGGETLYLAGLPAGSRITYFTTTPNLS